MLVMAGLVPAIHALLAGVLGRKAWMPATSAGMTRWRVFSHKEARQMSPFTVGNNIMAAGILAALACAASMAPAAAQQKGVPDFSSNQVGWVGLNGGGPNFAAVPAGLPPGVSDPPHPFVPSAAGAQPTYRIADLSNPNLKPWVKEH